MKKISSDKASVCSPYWPQMTFLKQYTITMEFSAQKLNLNTNPVVMEEKSPFL